MHPSAEDRHLKWTKTVWTATRNPFLRRRALLLDMMWTTESGALLGKSKHSLLAAATPAHTSLEDLIWWSSSSCNISSTKVDLPQYASNVTEYTIRQCKKQSEKNGHTGETSSEEPQHVDPINPNRHLNWKKDSMNCDQESIITTESVATWYDVNYGVRCPVREE